MEYCIVRTYSAGVFAGFVESLDGKKCAVLEAQGAEEQKHLTKTQEGAFIMFSSFVYFYGAASFSASIALALFGALRAIERE